MHRAGILALLSLAAAPVGAYAAVTALPTTEQSVAVARTAAACGAGNAFDVRWTAPASAPRVAMLARFAGAHGDWDLELRDARGRRVDASYGLGAREVVQATVPSGRGLVVRACRHDGASRRTRVRIESVALPAATPPATASLLKVAIGSRADGDRLQALGLDLGEDGLSGELSVVTHGARDLDLVRSTGLPFRVAVPDLAARDRAERATERRMAASIAGVLPSGRTSYRDFPAIQQEIKDLAAQFSAHARAFDLPLPSSQGRAIPAIEIADDPAAAATDGRPTFFVVGLHHAREWPAAEAAMELANDLLRSTDAATASLLAKIRVVIVPVQNPDGYTSSRGGLDLDPDSSGEELVTAQAGGGSQAYRRKTCSGPFPAAAPCDLQPGADSNRNYGANWSGVGSSTVPYEQDYRGAGPWSEPETENVHRLLQGLNATMVLSIHNVTGAVLRPPGVSSAPVPPDTPGLTSLGAKLAKLAGYKEATFYTGLGYDGSGITEDWSYDALGSYTYTIEMGPSGGQFHMSYPTGVVEEWTGEKRKVQGMRGALRELAAAAASTKYHSVITGTAPAGATIRVARDFKTSTGAPCTAAPGITVRNAVPALECLLPGEPLVFDDHVGFAMTVPASGTYAFHVPPSTRPALIRDGRTEPFTVTCERDGAVSETQPVTVLRGASAVADFACGQ